MSDQTEWVKSLVEAVSGAQARNTVHHYILREIAIDLAKTKPDPEGYLASMFERVSQLLDTGEADGNKPHILAEMRWVNESFFTRAGQAVRK